MWCEPIQMKLEFKHERKRTDEEEEKAHSKALQDDEAYWDSPTPR